MTESRQSDSLRFAYADPPYPGQASRHYKHHPDFGGEVDHAELVDRLMTEFRDGWALSTSASALRDVLELCPRGTPSRKNKGRYLAGTGVRVLAWCKSQAPWMPVHPQFAWEPVLLYGGRHDSRGLHTMDWLRCSMDHQRNSSPAGERLSGIKPREFCYWIFRCLGARPGDELVDLFPGSGAVGRAWEGFARQEALVA